MKCLILIMTVLLTLALAAPGLAKPRKIKISGYLEDDTPFVEPVLDHKTKGKKCPEGFKPYGVAEERRIILPNGQVLPCRIIRPVCVPKKKL